MLAAPSAEGQLRRAIERTLRKGSKLVRGSTPRTEAGELARATEEREPVEHQPRRTFAIISHPDAGKTTLTEKLLLFGGAIRMAGQVHARGQNRRTRSDWLEIERARGISVSSSVMTFESGGVTFNLLDTPGHEDFSEDTYRTLTAVDSAVMVIDAAKGIEDQTRKLFEVCRLREIPIMTFINKVDREGRDPFALLDEIESTLALEVAPMTWPVGMGVDFQGCYDLSADRFLAAGDGSDKNLPRALACTGIEDLAFDAIVSRSALETFRENASLAKASFPPFDAEGYRAGNVTPVFFGSALKNHAVRELLDALAAHAPGARPQPAQPRPIDPGEARVSGFVFKVQANTDRNHRDRVAFVRICSGRFQRGMKLWNARLGKWFAIRNPILFFAQDRDLAEVALPGDIIGIPNHGTLRVGDALTEGEEIRFTGIPNFAPEILREVHLEDPIRAKPLRRALQDLAEEGIAQVFRPSSGSRWIVGVVGALQLEVLESRLAAEYDVAVRFIPTSFTALRWLEADDKAVVTRFIERYRNSIALDREDSPVLLSSDPWALRQLVKEWPDLRFMTTRERS